MESNNVSSNKSVDAVPNDRVAAAFARTPLVAIIRHRDSSRTLDVVRALHAGGVELIEVTSSTPGWLDIIEEAAASGITVGGGTVTTVAQVAELAERGAHFVVSPGLDAEVVREADRLGLESFAGVLTPTEIQAGLALGLRHLKLFPAGSFGIGYLRQLMGPFNGVSFVPTGGVGIENIPAWFEAGASGIALGSELCGRTSPAAGESLQPLSDLAARAVALVSQSRDAGS